MGDLNPSRTILKPLPLSRASSAFHATLRGHPARVIPVVCLSPTHRVFTSTSPHLVWVPVRH